MLISIEADISKPPFVFLWSETALPGIGNRFVDERERDLARETSRLTTEAFWIFISKPNMQAESSCMLLL
jgi:hypothetical protein